MKFKKLTASFLLMLSTSVVAEVDVSSGVYGAIGGISLDSKESSINGISDSATYWRIGWEQHHDKWIWGAGVSGYLYSDNEGFSQNTTDGEKDSGASAVNGFLEAGYKYQLNDHISFSLIAGYEHVFSSTREIGFCSDCYSEDIDISGGIYIQPRATYLWDNDWYATISPNLYLSGDVETALFLTVGVLY